MTDEPVVGTSLWRDAWRRLRRNRMAVVSGIVHVDATIKGENRNLHLRYLNVWVKRENGWVLVARQATNLPAQN